MFYQQLPRKYPVIQLKHYIGDSFYVSNFRDDSFFNTANITYVNLSLVLLVMQITGEVSFIQ